MNITTALAALLLAIAGAPAVALSQGVDQVALINAGKNEQLSLLCWSHQVRLTPPERENVERLKASARSISGGVAAFAAGSTVGRSSFPTDSESGALACTNLVLLQPAYFEFFDAPPAPVKHEMQPMDLPLEIADSLRGQIQQCWNLPVGWTDPREVTVTIRFRLNEDGTVSGTPSIEQYPAGNYGPVAAEGAVRAVLQCGPYKLPADKYDQWGEVQMRFSPTT